MKSLKDYIIEAKKELVKGNGFRAWLYDKNNYNEKRLEELTQEIKDYANLETDIDWYVDTDMISATIKDKNIPNNLDRKGFSAGRINRPHNELEEILGKYHNMFPNKSQISISLNKIK